MDKQIRLFEPFFRSDEVLAEIATCLDVGWTGLGFKTEALEEAWKKYTKLPYAHFLNSATAALHLAVEVLKVSEGWEEGDEVISTPLTFVSTNHAILYSGLTPVFADIDEHLCLDPDSVLEAITPKTRAVIFVGMGGNAGQLERLSEICRDRNLRLILDAAHMAGSQVSGRDAGALADVACYSFQAVKNLPTADSGMVCFSQRDWDLMAREMSWLGINKDTYSRSHGTGYSWEYDVDYLGYKYHGNSVVASMGLVALRYLEADNMRRREIAAIYDRELEGVEGIVRIKTPPDTVSSRHLYQIRHPMRDRLIDFLAARGVSTGVHYKSNTMYPMYEHLAGTTPFAEQASDEVISLPMHLRLTDQDVLDVTRLVTQFVAND